MRAARPGSRTPARLRLPDLLLSAVVLLAAAPLAAAQTTPPCAPTPERHAERLSGEVAGAHPFIAETREDWRLALEPAPFGWELRLRDARGLDLSAMTPPRRFGVNPRDIHGWHFRNAANTGPNDGSVNAPGALRPFEFEPGWAGTAGPKAPLDQIPPGAGRGWLLVEDIGLASLAPDEQARAVYLRFSACLTWPKAPEEIAAEADAADPVHTSEEEARFARCGGPEAGLSLSAWLLPRRIEGDFDGDGGLDMAFPALRDSDGARVIALCLSRSRLVILADPVPESSLTVENLEAWRSEPSERGRPDALLLERIEKSMHSMVIVDDAPIVTEDWRIVTQEP